MRRSKKVIIIEVLSCFLLLVFSLYASASQARTEKENIRETVETDMQNKQASINETKQVENNILTDVLSGSVENAETDFPVLTENPNPYFFPDDVMTVTYDCNRKNNSQEKKTKQIKMLVYREKAFPKGILYNLKAEMEESFSVGDAGNQEKEDLELGHFYVQADKIYLVRDLEIRQDTTEEDLIEAGTVICQSESKAENEETRNVLGSHEMIKVADGKCAFYGHYDIREEDDFYEYFIWQEGKGLTGYRSGHDEVEDIELCMNGIENAGFDDENAFNPYFFSKDKTIVDYEGEFEFFGTNPETGFLESKKIDVKLSVSEEKSFENGVLYDINIVNDGRFYFDDSEIGEQDRKRMHLGYFYVQADKIYLIRDVAVDTDITERELVKYGKVICQPEPKGDILEPDEKGRHESIGIVGDQCIYGWAQNYIETDWWESFIWQKGLGLVEYKSGRGALDRMIYITIKP